MGNNLSMYFGTSGCPLSTFVPTTSANVRRIECAYAALGSTSNVSDSDSGRRFLGVHMRSSFVVSRTTSISNRSDWIQSFLRKARIRQYLRRSVSAERGGARSGRDVKRRGRVVSVTCLGARVEISVKSSRIPSLKILSNSQRMH